MTVIKKKQPEKDVGRKISKTGDFGGAEDSAARFPSGAGEKLDNHSDEQINDAPGAQGQDALSFGENESPYRSDLLQTLEPGATNNLGGGVDKARTYTKATKTVKWQSQNDSESFE